MGSLWIEVFSFVPFIGERNQRRRAPHLLVGLLVRFRAVFFEGSLCELALKGTPKRKELSSAMGWNQTPFEVIRNPSDGYRGGNPS